jgi:hypothetical protein
MANQLYNVSAADSLLRFNKNLIHLRFDSA